MKSVITNATSHQYAHCLQQFAEFLLSRPEFEIPWSTPTSFFHMSYYSPSDKEKFIGAVKALGSGKKKFTDEWIEFSVKAPGTDEFTIKAPRNIVCRLVKPAEYECDPFFSPEEISQMDSGQ